MDYLESFKKLLVCNLIAFLALMAVNMFLASKILNVISYGYKLYVFGIGEALSTLLYISFSISAVMYFPIFFFSVTKFFDDALYPHEKKLIKKYSIVVFILGAIGVFVGFQVAKYTVLFGKIIADILGVELVQSAKELFLINFSIIIGTAVCFEMFPVLRMLIEMGFVKKESVVKHRWLVYLIMYLLVAILTPGDYLIGDITLFSILVVLFELTLRL